MRGQTSVVATAGTVIVVAVLLVVGAVIYGYFMQSTPHDLPYFKEVMCTTCTPLALYSFGHYPINNDTTLTCGNASSTTGLTNGRVANATTGYNIVADGSAGGHRYLNLTTPAAWSDYYQKVQCNYYYNVASNDQETFWSNASQNGLAGFTVLSVMLIVLVATAIIVIIVLLKG